MNAISRLHTVILTIILSLVSLSASASAANQPTLLIKLKSGHSIAQLDQQLSSKYLDSSAKPMFKQARLRHAKPGSKTAQLKRWYSVSNCDQACIEQWRSNPSVEWVETPVYRTLDSTSSNTSSDEQSKDRWHIDAIKLRQARDWLTQNGANNDQPIVIAVIDSGVDYSHSKIAPYMWRNPGETAVAGYENDGIDNDGNGFVDDVYGASVAGLIADHSGDPMDSQGHGTHVAGIIAEQIALLQDSGIGPIRIMAINATKAGILSSVDIAEAVDYARANGADIINMSFGGLEPSQAEREAIEAAYESAVLVASAGNNGRVNAAGCQVQAVQKYYPAAYPFVIGVMSSQKDPNPSGTFLYKGSNWDCNPFDDVEYSIMAPGVAIWSTLPGEREASWNGTSMASPMVAGVAALVRQQYPDKQEYPSRFVVNQVINSGPVLPAKLLSDATTLIEYRQLDAHAALTASPQPVLSLDSHYFWKSRTDLPNDAASNPPLSSLTAGQSVDIGLLLNNLNGQANDIKVTLTAVDDRNQAVDWIRWQQNQQVLTSRDGHFQASNGLRFDASNGVIGSEQPFRFSIADTIDSATTLTFIASIDAGNQFDPNNQYRYPSQLTFRVTVKPAAHSNESGGAFWWSTLALLLMRLYRRR
ncbi:S8 family serine peptidase [Paraferrimonas haliotis]|uniref:Peptidase S8/S53 domain-containing protein n=1 Tax=Paraferrimonas haliotis TaxID=2013866 RepID=A0AA37WZF6_9GAMM|nr:S8 family serine peptidase [Paraferrimonas haliotis]GLS83886.1 hypothetical protein GCM10007894_18630 [Paraferrimonas haliotis]GLS84013.1 hypothetical protein GCM10007894_19900 [Paraferrimonas haliotis]